MYEFNQKENKKTPTGYVGAIGRGIRKYSGIVEKLEL